MILEETTFDKLDIGDECIFRDEQGKVIHCHKHDAGTVIPHGESHRHVTGQFHQVYKIVK